MTYTPFKFWSKLKLREDTEHEQAFLRIVLCIVFTVYTLHWPESVALQLVMIPVISGILGILIFIAILLNPKKSVIRRLFGVIVDITALSFAMYSGGDWIQSLFWMYLFIIIGNGFRYGLHYMYFTSTLSLIGVALAWANNLDWALSTQMSMGIVLGITILTFYLASLLNRLNNALDNANAANAAKSQFLANMSHEIRTPMNGVLGMLDISLNSALPPQIKKQLLVAQSSANSLLFILNDILDISKLEAGKVSLEKHDFDVSNLVAETIALLKPKAQQKGIEVVSLISPNIPDYINSDPHRLRQVLLNLLSNAIKFTKNGKIVVVLSAISSKQNIEIQCSVKDEGIGMAEEDKEHIFDIFTQADDSTTRKFGGTGLGLAISKMIVEQMKGRITVDSTLGQGSTFSFTILAGHPSKNTARANDKVLSSNDDGANSLSLSPLTQIMLVEDNRINQEVIGAMIRKLGAQITTKENGQKALDYFKKHPDHAFDVILMDCQMPELDGYETTKELLDLWGEAPESAIPIIALTANTMPEDRSRCFSVGMDDYLAKPLHLETLYSMLVKWIPKNKVNQKAEFDSVNTEVSPILANKLPESFFDMDTLHEVQKVMGSQFPAMIDKYYQSSLQLVSEMETHFKNDLQELGKTTHSLKGSSAALGIKKLSHLCQTIENQIVLRDSDKKIEKNLKHVKKLLLVTVDLLRKIEPVSTNKNGSLVKT